MTTPPAQNRLRQLVDLSVFSRDARTLLLVNILFGLVLPLETIFANAFIWRQANDFTLNFAYTFASFVGVPSGFALNGWLLRRVPIKYLYVTAMILVVLLLLNLFFIQGVTVAKLVPLGLINGAAIGLYWSNRTYLVLMKTDDQNRNYFTSIEAFVIVICDVVTAFLTGQFIGNAAASGWYTPNQAYQIVAGVALVLVLMAGAFLSRGHYTNPVIRRFLYWRYVRRWQFMRLYMIFLGITEGCTVILPTLLILKFLGNEGSLGLIESASAVLSVLVVYFVGKFSQPQHRVRMVTAGVSLILLGTLSFSLLYSGLGVILFQVSYIFSNPLIFTAYRATMMRSIDYASRVEQRDEYAYIIDGEVTRNLGRILGGCVFLALFYLSSEKLALQSALVILAVLQFNTIWLCRYLNPKEEIVVAGVA